VGSDVGEATHLHCIPSLPQDEMQIKYVTTILCNYWIRVRVKSYGGLGLGSTLIL